jgi:hypothetical protein
MFNLDHEILTSVPAANSALAERDMGAYHPVSRGRANFFKTPHHSMGKHPDHLWSHVHENRLNPGSCPAKPARPAFCFLAGLGSPSLSHSG